MTYFSGLFNSFMQAKPDMPAPKSNASLPALLEFVVAHALSWCVVMISLMYPGIVLLLRVI